jgi:hypothetical protein
VTPYRRPGELPSAAPEPAHARLGLLLVAAGGVTSFAPLFALHFVGRWNETFAAVLAIGSALLIVGLLWSARDPGAGRLLAVVAAFLLTAGYFLPNLGYTRASWPLRYAAVTAAAVSILVRLQRARPGSLGIVLRSGAVIGAWWAVARVLGEYVRDAEGTGTVELIARLSFVGLGVGAWLLRPFLGTVPLVAPESTAIDRLREMAATRLAVAALAVAIGVQLCEKAGPATHGPAMSYSLVAAAILLTQHAPRILRDGTKRERIMAGATALVACGAMLLACLTWGAVLSGATAAALVTFTLADVAMDAVLFDRASTLQAPPALRSAFLLRAFMVLGAVLLFAPKIASVLAQR